MMDLLFFYIEMSPLFKATLNEKREVLYHLIKCINVSGDGQSHYRTPPLGTMNV